MAPDPFKYSYFLEQLFADRPNAFPIMRHLAPLISFMRTSNSFSSSVHESRARRDGAFSPPAEPAATSHMSPPLASLACEVSGGSDERSRAAALRCARAGVALGDSCDAGGEGGRGENSSSSARAMSGDLSVLPSLR